MTEITPAQPHPAVLELAKAKAALAAGLTIAQGARLQGVTDEELTADATAFAAELNAGTPTAPATLVGGSQGPDVGNATGVAAGASLYRDRYGIVDGERPARTSRSPLTENTYTMNGRW
ncbi:hypothetical protein ACFVTC_01900 [Streptomyces sp. NPDC057950]|uniref:hypothetical protein n=1 Tax=Streptomyces sp. NPDC057950 TaxID=3346288 RepID=UPI0036E2C43E